MMIFGIVYGVLALVLTWAQPYRSPGTGPS